MSVCLLLKWESASFLQLWLALSLLSLVSLSLFSGVCFFALYWQPKYEIWKYKINPHYPSPYKVREEVIVMLQGLLFSTICPALSLYLTMHNRGYGYCEINESNGGWTWIATSFFIVWIFTDFYEFLYHWCGHSFQSMWKLHKGHHHFYNPTPFAVIADNPIDQFFRAAPLLFFPMIFPVNIEMLFTMFSVLFYFNGLIQHSGYEPYHLDKIGIDGHNKYLLTSYHHYLHHAKSSMNRPLYNGQLLQLWDYLAGSHVYIPLSSTPTTSGEQVASAEKSTCLCSKCAREQGLRSLDEWNRLAKPDYSVLLSVSFWLSPNPESSHVKSA